MKCENCEAEHSGEYGSGRFCATKCARGFSTKSKRKEINKKVSKSLSGRGNGKVEIECKKCGKLVLRDWNRRQQKFCSKSCSAIFLNALPETREKLSKARIKAIKEGKTNHRSIKCEYKYKDHLIECDSKIEYACLDYFEKKLNATFMQRCNEVIEYFDGGQKRRYLPDFLIQVGEVEYIVECKSYAGKTLNAKWRRYNELAEIKKDVLKDYAQKTNRQSYWFTKDIHIKFYNELKF
tara:strand:- start:332 stop:1042 length:711 start_codon:yes stop_codon:yes gene_type:complete